MRPLARMTCALAAAGLAAGCATAPPADFPVANKRDYAMRKDEAFDRIVSLSARNSYYVTGSDRRTGLVTLERALAAQDRGGTVRDWADCGAVSLLERPLSQTVELSVLVEPKGAGSTVTINSRFSELRSDLNRKTREVPCTTTGQLEYEMLALVAR